MLHQKEAMTMSNLLRRLLLSAFVMTFVFALSGCGAEDIVIDEVKKDDTMWVSSDGNAWFYSSYDNMRNYGQMNIGAIRLDTYWYDFCPDYYVENSVVRGIIFPDGIDTDDMYTKNLGGVRIYSAEQIYGTFSGIYTLDICFINDNGYMEKDTECLEFVALEKLQYDKKYTCDESSVYFMLGDDKTFTMYDGRSAITGEIIQRNRDLIMKVSDDEYYVFIREIDDEGLIYSKDRSYGDVNIPDDVWFYAE